MLFKLKQSLLKQILLLLGLTGLSFGLSMFFEFAPRLRVNFQMFCLGILGGLFCYLLLLILHFLALLVQPAKHYSCLNKDAEFVSNSSVFSILGAALSAGAAEELFFRAFVFSLCIRIWVWLGFLVNFILMLFCYFRGREYFLWTLIKAIECSAYALLYYNHRSLFMIATAHATAELALSFTLRNSSIQEFLKNQTFSISWLKSLIKT